MFKSSVWVFVLLMNWKFCTACRVSQIDDVKSIKNFAALNSKVLDVTAVRQSGGDDSWDQNESAALDRVS